MLAFWIGPRIWREAERHGLLTVGDFLEHHFGRGVRGLAAGIIWLGQLRDPLRRSFEARPRCSSSSAGWSLAAGALSPRRSPLRGYFVLGGLVSAARVNRVQLVVILARVRARGADVAAMTAGGAGRRGRSDGGFWRGRTVGWPTLFLLGPAFFLSPGLLQKAYGARDAAALTRGVAWNGVALLDLRVRCR